MAKNLSVSNYRFSITAKKALVIAAEVVVAGLVVYFTDNSLYLGIVPLLEAARNWLKHHKD